MSVILILALASPPLSPPEAIPPRPPGKHWPLSADAHQGAPTFREGRPVLGTTYFYWYDFDSKQHIIDPDGTDALTTHPADLEGTSYRSVEWHRRQLSDVTAAGIDFVLPVYWGCPDDTQAWSFTGLGPLVEAHEQLLREGRDPPAIGLFYDTSTLRHNRRGIHIDLSTAWGREWFAASVRDFFSCIPPRTWARIDDKPVVFLYAASFAARQDPGAFEHLRDQFRKEFSTDIYLVRHVDWKGRADAFYCWGGALGLRLGDKVASLGPGYDHSAVPGRSPLVQDRQNGDFYRQNWTRLLSMSPRRRPFLVHVETWNEWHEGTDVAASREYGRTYIELTRHFSERFHAGARLEPEGAFSKARQVAWTPAKDDGLTIRPSGGDGLWSGVTVAGREAVVSAPAPQHGGCYLYFLIDDSFLFDADGAEVHVTVEYLDQGCAHFAFEYDNVRPDRGPLAGAFRRDADVRIGGTGKILEKTFKIVEGRFANRTNGADFRLAIEGDGRALTVTRVSVAKP